MTDIVVSKLQGSSLVSMVIGEATNKTSVSVDSEKKQLLDISSTSDIKSEVRFKYWCSPKLTISCCSVIRLISIHKAITLV